jgi:hypothetical protein
VSVFAKKLTLLSPEKLTVAPMVAILVLSTSPAARAGGGRALSDAQLDRVTAAEAVVISSANGAANGVLAMTQTATNSIAVGGLAPFKGQPGLTDDVGATDGTATAVGTNLAVQGDPPASSTTSVTTGGSAVGNQVVNSTYNQTFHDAGGVTFQAGWTFVSGSWVGL